MTSFFKRRHFCFELYSLIIVMIFCGNCGEVFRRVHWNNRGKKSVVWRCVSRLENTGLFCDARTVLESNIEQVLVTAINEMLCHKDGFLSTLQDNITTVLSRERPTALTEYNESLIRRLIEKVTVYEDKFTIEFKSGVTVDVNE